MSGNFIIRIVAVWRTVSIQFRQTNYIELNQNQTSMKKLNNISCVYNVFIVKLLIDT
jgi:hypothetical protein